MKTHIAVVLDRSGSMNGLAEEAAGTVNSYIRNLKDLPGKKRVTITQFDHEFEITCQGRTRKETPELVVGENYIPRGMTALYDAIGRTISLLEDKKNVIVTIMTDGHENDSKEYTLRNIEKLIAKCKEKGWEIIFLGSDLSNTAAAQAWGIDAANTPLYANNARGFAQRSAYMSATTTAYVDQKLSEGKDSDSDTDEVVITSTNSV